MPDEAEQYDERSEQALVVRRRYLEARQYGFTRLEARLFSESNADISELRRLRDLGCRPDLAAKIVL